MPATIALTPCCASLHPSPCPVLWLGFLSENPAMIVPADRRICATAPSACLGLLELRCLDGCRMPPSLNRALGTPGGTGVAGLTVSWSPCTTQVPGPPKGWSPREHSAVPRASCPRTWCLGTEKSGGFGLSEISVHLRAAVCLLLRIGH